MGFVTRFAPSPTGPLHLGHAYSAILAHDMARKSGGRFLLRIEDIDWSRSRPEWEELIYEDLRWLGLSWEDPVMRQSERLDAYHEVLKSLWDQEAVFACTCNRRDILAAASAPHEGDPPTGPDGVIYPGTCRTHRSKQGSSPIPGDAALRLDMEKASAFLTFEEAGAGPKGEAGQIQVEPDALVRGVGDVVAFVHDDDVKRSFCKCFPTVGLVKAEFGIYIGRIVENFSQVL